MPLPSPSRIDTLSGASEQALATARSRMPLPVKSPATIALGTLDGSSPSEIGGSATNPPWPLPSRIDTPSVL